jgi:hypothetical protein
VNGASSAFTVTNTNLAPAGFQELLNASAGAGSAGVTLTGVIDGLAPGASSNNFVIGFAPGGSAGPRSGSATVALVSDGTGTSGLGLLGLPGSPVAVTGTAFNLAAGAATPAPVVVPNQRLGGVGGGSASVALNIANTAPAGAFSEALNASFAALAGDAVGNGGSVLNLAAGASNGSAMTVTVDNTQAGARSGSVTLAFASDGTGPNGNSGLAAVNLGTQTLGVSGNVYRLAQASAVTPNVVNLGSVRAGTLLSQALTLSNLAAADGFSERPERHHHRHPRPAGGRFLQRPGRRRQQHVTLRGRGHQHRRGQGRHGHAAAGLRRQRHERPRALRARHADRHRHRQRLPPGQRQRRHPEPGGAGQPARGRHADASPHAGQHRRGRWLLGGLERQHQRHRHGQRRRQRQPAGGGGLQQRAVRGCGHQHGRRQGRHRHRGAVLRRHRRQRLRRPGHRLAERDGRG